jgi:hypothetical protein
MLKTFKLSLVAIFLLSNGALLTYLTACYSFLLACEIMFGEMIIICCCHFIYTQTKKIEAQFEDKKVSKAQFLRFFVIWEASVFVAIAIAISIASYLTTYIKML